MITFFILTLLHIVSRIGMYGLLCNFIVKDTLAQLFSCEICEISKNTFYTGQLRSTASACFENSKENSENFQDSLIKNHLLVLFWFKSWFNLLLALRIIIRTRAVVTPIQFVCLISFPLVIKEKTNHINIQDNFSSNVCESLMLLKLRYYFPEFVHNWK